MFLVFHWTATTWGCSYLQLYEKPARILFPWECPPLLFQSPVKYSRSNVLQFCLLSLFHFTLMEEFSISHYQAETIENFLWDFWLTLVFTVSYHQVIVMKLYSKFLPKRSFRITHLISLYANLYSFGDTLKKWDNYLALLDTRKAFLFEGLEPFFPELLVLKTA